MVRGGKEGAWMDGDKCQDDVCVKGLVRHVMRNGLEAVVQTLCEAKDGGILLGVSWLEKIIKKSCFNYIPNFPVARQLHFPHPLSRSLHYLFSAHVQNLLTFPLKLKTAKTFTVPLICSFLTLLILVLFQ